MCIQANHYLSADMDAAMKHAADTEQSELGKKILHQLQDNLKIADDSDLSGHRNGSDLSGSRTGCPF